MENEWASPARLTLAPPGLLVDGHLSARDRAVAAELAAEVLGRERVVLATTHLCTHDIATRLNKRGVQLKVGDMDSHKRFTPEKRACAIRR
eukprot:6191425-Pleurochrysis_carterae.AAC.1